MKMRKNHRSCDAIADYFLLQQDSAAGDSITNLKMQKLCYYSQGWSLALHSCALFDEEIEAWAHGPAIPALYHRFKGYGWQAIDPLELITDPVRELPADVQDLLDEVWLKYGRFSGKQLELMTHREQPWKEAYGDTPPGRACCVEITQESMQQYFSSLISPGHESNSRTKTARRTQSRKRARPI